MSKSSLVKKDLILLNHYEVLGLQRNCAKEDIRQAFLELSKEYHPDLSKNGNETHRIFVRINEAYSVLSKPSSRQMYDATLLRGFAASVNATNDVNNYSESAAYWKDSSIWEFRDKSKDQYYKSRPYYGIKGLQRVTNGQIVAACFIFMAVGASFHYFFIKGSSNKTRAYLDERDRQVGKSLSEVRRSAIDNGNQSQLEALKARFRNKTDGD
ncbi:dnaJ-like protein 60 [Artemia franciscana]|uniref:dnaJ-like protein 60 n=1 Tax=Artemia franciscana TaxID=6661 RepID=UPI0032DB6676